MALAPTRIAFQGASGCYSHIAGRQYARRIGVEPDFHGRDSFALLLDAVQCGEVELALLPIENTTAGTISESYDLLAERDLVLTGEHYLLVTHCLLGVPGARVEDVRRVRSHPMALAQCRGFLGSLTECVVERYTDTAMAASAVAEAGDRTEAAIASALAGEERGLVVLAEDIGDLRDNTTRFVAVQRADQAVVPVGPCKTSVVMSLEHEQGALYRTLGLLMEYGLNLTKLESRPTSRAWRYHFYLDFLGTGVPDAALDALAAHTPWMKHLGTYPAAERPGVPVVG